MLKWPTLTCPFNRNLEEWVTWRTAPQKVLFYGQLPKGHHFGAAYFSQIIAAHAQLHSEYCFPIKTLTSNRVQVWISMELTIDVLEANVLEIWFLFPKRCSSMISLIPSLDPCLVPTRGSMPHHQDHCLARAVPSFARILFDRCSSPLLSRCPRGVRKP